MFNWKELAYAVNYASSALLVSAGLMAKTHEGTIGMIGQHYVRTGVLTKEDGALLARLQNMRHTGDYDDFLDWTQEAVEPCFPKVDAYIEKIKSIIYSHINGIQKVFFLGITPSIATHRTATHTKAGNLQIRIL